MTQMSALETASAIRTGQTSVIEVVEDALDRAFEENKHFEASFLVDAPPGSDVAGTLAAVFADAAASGRTVLHVPATSADGHAVALRALPDYDALFGIDFHAPDHSTRTS
mgnify:CR=1 FL=1